MADKKISALDAAAALAGTEEVPIVQAGETVRTTAQAIANLNRTALTADTTYHVAITGSDVTGDGSIGTPWATPQHAQDYIVESVDLAGFDLTVKIGDGAYQSLPSTQCVLFVTRYTGGGIINFVGNTTTPGNVIFDANDDGTHGTFGVYVLANCTLQGITFINSNLASYSDAAIADFALGTHTYVGNCVFDGVFLYHIWVAACAGVSVSDNYAITAGAAAHVFCEEFGQFAVESVTVTLTGTPNFTTAYTWLFNQSTYYSNGATYTGAATGPRFLAQLNSVIATPGSSSLTLLPGNVAGTLDGLSVYNNDFAGTSVLTFNGATSGGSTIKAQAIAGTHTFELPTTVGSSGDVLSTDGSDPAILSWATPGSTANLVVGTSTITSGTTKHIVYDNAGVVGEAANFTIESGNPSVTTGNAYLYNGLNLAFQVDPGGGNQLNTFLGGAGNLTVTGFGNFGEGPSCLSNVSTGNRNMGMGAQALETVSTGGTNSAIGALALNKCTGDSNMAVGASALFNLSSGTRNVAIGTSALLAETVGLDNVAVGDGAGNAQNGATNNVLIGRDTGSGLSTGSFNTFVGNQTGLGITTGAYNTVIGQGFTSANSAIVGAIIFQSPYGTEFDVNYTNAGKFTIGNTRTLIIPALSTAGIVVNNASGDILTNSTVNAATVAGNFAADHRLTLTIAGSTYYLPVSTVAW